MERILNNNTTYTYYKYPSEKEFEQVIIEQAQHIFGFILTLRKGLETASLLSPIVTSLIFHLSRSHGGYTL